MSLQSDDRIERLVALRVKLAGAIEDAEPRELAPLSRQLLEVEREIAELAPPPPPKGNPLDELDQRRASRGAKPAAKPGPAGKRR